MTGKPLLPLRPSGWRVAPAEHAYRSDDGRFALFAGVRGANPATGEFPGDTLQAQVAAARDNILALLESCSLPRDASLFLRVQLRHTLTEDDRRSLERTLVSWLMVATPVVTLIERAAMFDDHALVEVDGVAVAA